MQRSIGYTFGFAAVVCMICSIMVSTSAVSLSERQDVNILLDRQKNVLEAVGLKTPGEKLTPEEVQERYKNIEVKLVDMKTGQFTDAVDPNQYDQIKASRDPSRSFEAPSNAAKVPRVPNYGLVYQLIEDGKVKMHVFPIEGMGLWSTLRGFLAVDAADLKTVKGITYYSHAETPGLGGEVDNPLWKKLWPGRKLFDEAGETKLSVIKGAAGPVAEDPYQVDGLSGATITARGVTNMLHFWFGDSAYGKFIDKLRAGEVS